MACWVVTWTVANFHALQERASKQLPGPGQHFSFGALLPWTEIQVLLDQLPGEIQTDGKFTEEGELAIHH